MSKYIVKAETAPGGNPDFAPDSELVHGIEADGFVILLMKDDRPYCQLINGVTTMDLARMIAADDKSEAGSVISQAIAIAEGLKKAAEIAERYRKDKAARDLVEILRAK